MLTVHRNHKAYYGRGEGEERGIEVGDIYIYIHLHCHHQNDSCIKMGSGESQFNVLLIVRDRVTRQYPQTTIFLKRRESRSGIEPRPAGPSAYR